MEISIGKFTLESLTTGMYNEPETCYREYIQNAVDAIDTAVEKGIISIPESRIEIIVNEENEWECPNCGNKDHNKMNVTRRTCGYLGENFWNVRKNKRN